MKTVGEGRPPDIETLEKALVIKYIKSAVRAFAESPIVDLIYRRIQLMETRGRSDDVFRFRILWCLDTAFRKTHAPTMREVVMMRNLRAVRFSYGEIAFILDRSKSTVHRYLNPD